MQNYESSWKNFLWIQINCWECKTCQNLHLVSEIESRGRYAKSFDLFFVSSNKHKYQRSKKILDSFGIRLGFLKSKFRRNSI